ISITSGGFAGRYGRSGGVGNAAGTLSFNVRAKRSTLPEALNLLKQILREPALDEKELELMKPSRIASLEESRTDPSELASNLLSRTLSPYPAGDIRAVLTPDEQIARIKAGPIDEVRRGYSEDLGGTHGELVI